MNKQNIRISFLRTLAVAACCALTMASCDDDMGSQEVPNEPYVLSLGITSNGTTTYYVVTTADLMSSTPINAYGKGIEQNGYRDYQQAGQTVFSIGGLGVTSATGIQRDGNGYIQEHGDFVFNNTPIGFCQVDDNTMAAMELPSSAGKGEMLTFYTVDISSIALKSKVTTTPVAPMDVNTWPTVTGSVYSNGNLYVSYVPMNPTTFATPAVDTAFVAVYSYPDFKFKKLMKDTRTGNIGSWNAFNGFQKDESGDIYAMSNTSLTNGFSQKAGHSGFLRIKAGSTDFDPDYFFDYEALTGYKVAHWLYIGQGKVYAEVSTNQKAGAWSDAEDLSVIIDLYNKTSTTISEIPKHSGQGGRRFVAFAENGFVYAPIATADGVYIYRTDVATATAVRGAKVQATFVGGLFKLQ